MSNQINPSPSDQSTPNSDFESNELTNIAQKASGINPEQNKKDEDDEITNDDLYPTPKSPPGFLDPNNPVIKIAIGILMTGVFAIGTAAIYITWNKFMNTDVASEPKVDSPEPIIDTKQQEIDSLKADLALIDQNTDSIEPVPDLPPQVTEPVASPSEPEPKIVYQTQPQPEPVDPYVRWASLSGLGTMGNSDVIVQQWEANTPTATSNPNFSQSTPVQRRQKTLRYKGRGQKVTCLHGDLDPQGISFKDNPSAFCLLPSAFLLSPLAQKIITDGLGGTFTPPRAPSDKSDNSRKVPLGTTIKAKLITPIAWSNDSDISSMRGNIILSEPLLDSHGDIVLDPDTALIVQVKSFAPSGLAVLEARALSYFDSTGQLVEREINPQTFLIKGKNHQPIKAKVKSINNNSNLAGNLLNNAVRAGTSNSSSVASSLINQTANSLNRRNYYSRDFIYEIKEGTKLSVYVNSFLTND